MIVEDVVNLGKALLAAPMVDTLLEIFKVGFGVVVGVDGEVEALKDVPDETGVDGVEPEGEEVVEEGLDVGVEETDLLPVTLDNSHATLMAGFPFVEEGEIEEGGGDVRTEEFHATGFS